MTIYLDNTNGNDANPGTSTALAVRTFDRAYDLAASDNRVVEVMNGTYTNKWELNRNGSNSNRYVVQPYLWGQPGAHSPKILGNQYNYDSDTDTIVKITGDYNIFRGFRIEYCDEGRGIHVYNANHVWIEHNDLYWIFGRAIGGVGDYVYIRYNTLDSIVMENANDEFNGQAGWAGGIATHDSCDYWEISHNTMSNCHGEGIMPKHSEHFSVHHNVVTDAFSVGYHLSRVQDMEFYDNIYISTSNAHRKNGKLAHGIDFANEATTSHPVTNLNIYRNIVIGARSGIRWWTDQGGSADRFTNVNIDHCIFYGIEDHTFDADAPGGSSSATVTNCIIYEGGDGYEDISGSSNWTFANNCWVGGSVPSSFSGNGNFSTSNPGVKNPGGITFADWELTEGSPCVQAGSRTVATTDYKGNDFNVTCDIGVHSLTNDDGSSNNNPPSSGDQTTATVYAVDDTHISKTNPTSNYSPNATLDIRRIDSTDAAVALLRFDLSSIPSDATADSVALKMNSQESADSAVHNIFVCLRDIGYPQATWEEWASGADWQTDGAEGALDKSGTLLGSIVFPPNAADTIATGTLTAATIQGYFGGFVDLVINIPELEDDVINRWHSKDSTDPASRPRLEVTYTPAAGTPSGEPSGTKYTASADTQLKADSAGSNYASEAYLRVRRIGSSSAAVSILSIDLSSIPASATCTSATLRLFSQNSAASRTHEIFVLLRDPTYIEATWNEWASGSSWTAGGAEDAADREQAAIGSVAFPDNLIDTAADIALTPSKIQSYFGDTIHLLVRIPDGESSLTNYWHSLEASSPDLRPALYVEHDATPDGNATGEQTAYAHYGTASSNTVENNATADTYLKKNDPTDNYDIDSTLKVRNVASSSAAVAILEFDLSAIPADATCDSATLKLTSSSSKSTRTHDIFVLLRSPDYQDMTWEEWATDDEWQTDGAEGALDRHQTAIGSMAYPDSSSNTQATAALTPATIQSYFGNVIHLVVRVDSGSNIDHFWYSIEHSNDTRRPKLEVEYTAAAAPTLTTSASDPVRAASDRTDPDDIAFDYGALRMTLNNPLVQGTIESATLDFDVSSTTGNAHSVSTVFELAADPAAFTDRANFDGRVWTSSVEWGIPAHTSSSTLTTPDISALLQEILDAGHTPSVLVIRFTLGKENDGTDIRLEMGSPNLNITYVTTGSPDADALGRVTNITRVVPRSPMRLVIAGQLDTQWNGRAKIEYFSVGPHGFEDCKLLIQLDQATAFFFHSSQQVKDISLDLGGLAVYEGRIEDSELTAEGLVLTALSHWRALTDTLYTNLWSDKSYERWQPITSEQDSGYTPDKYNIDKTDRLYVSFKKNQVYASGTEIGGFTYETPDGSARGITRFTCDLKFKVPSGMTIAYAIAYWSRDFGSRTAVLVSSNTGASTNFSPGFSVPFTVADVHRIEVSIYNNGGSDYTYTDEDGEAYLQLTNVRVSTADSSGTAVLASKIAEHLVSDVNSINAGALANTSIADTSLDITQALYEDARPADILTALAGLTHEVGITRQKRLYFLPRFSQARQYVIDVDDQKILSSIEGLYNATYGTYTDANQTTRRTDTTTDSSSVYRYGLTRNNSVSAETTTDEAAEVARDASNAATAETVPAVTIPRVKNIWTASGAPATLTNLKYGDLITIRNLPDSSLAKTLRLYRIKHYPETADADLELEAPSVSLKNLL